MSLTVYFDRIVFNADEVFSKDKKNISTVHELCTSQMVKHTSLHDRHRHSN